MKKSVTLSLALAGAAMVAAACSGGGGGSTSVLPTGNTPVSGGPVTQTKVTFSIKVPFASGTTSSIRKPGYVSSATQSIGVVVTNQGVTASPAQYVNVSSCPLAGGVATCSVSVSALPGNDAFTVSTYSATNGGGSVLSTGSITSTIVAGQANVTNTLTLGGVVASIAIAPGITTLPLGQSTTLNVVAKDAGGATIVGTFDNPISISASNLVLSKSSVTNSTDAANITAAWSYGYDSATSSTVTATGDGATGTVSIAPGTGFAYYQTGTNPATDTVGFKMIAGSDGNLYYTTLGPVACPTGQPCVSGGGAVHRFNPTTKTDTEVALKGEGVGMTFSSDGALWIAGGTPTVSDGQNYIYRMAPGSFSSSALTPIAVPTTSARGTASIRTFAQDGSGNLWFVDAAGSRYMKIPVAGPYASSSISFNRLPRGTTGTPNNWGRSRNIHYLNGALIIDDFQNGEEDVVNPSTATVSGQYLTNLQKSFAAPTLDSADSYDSTADATNVYVTNLGDWNAALSDGDIEAFNASTNTFTTLPYVSSPVGEATQPTVPSVNGNYLYIADFPQGGIQLVNLSTNTVRAYPQYGIGGSPFELAGAMAATNDGTAWFPCYASSQTFMPLCVGHTVYLSGWSIFPSSSITLWGAGTNNAQLMGIMESPTANSGPFTVQSSNTSVCTVASASDHNFQIVGQSAGACSVTVKDKNGLTQTVNVTVTTINGTVQAKHLGGI